MSLPERLILGHMLRSETAAWAMRSRLKAQMFDVAFHRLLFAAIGEVLDQGKRPSPPLLAGRLGERTPDGVDVAIQINVMIGEAEDSSDPLDHADDLVQSWRRKTAATVAAAFAKKLKKPETDLDSALAELAEKVADLIGGEEAPRDKPLPELLARVLHGGETRGPGLDTGIKCLDDMLGPILPGDLGVIAGSPGDGKTLLGLQIAKRAAAQKRVLFFELEMRAEDLARRLLASEVNRSAGEIEAGDWDLMSASLADEAEARLGGLQLSIVDTPKLSIAEIRARAMASQRTVGLDLIVIDHLRLIRSQYHKADKFERMEEAAEGAKVVAKELRIPVILLSQRTRESQRRDDPAPRMIDLDGGGTLEQFADWVIGLFRRDVWIKTVKLGQEMKKRKGSDDPYDPWVPKYYAELGKVELSLLKHRRRQASETCKARFNGAHSVITDEPD